MNNQVSPLDIAMLSAHYHHDLRNPAKTHQRGEVLTEAEVIDFFNMHGSVRSHASITSHSFCFRYIDHPDYDEVMFFSRNHLFGYKVLPSDFVACSFGANGNCVAREGVEDGVMDTFDKWKVVHGERKRFIFSLDELVDFLVNEYPALSEQKAAVES